MMKYRLYVHRLVNPDGTPNEKNLAELRRLHSKGLPLTLVSRQGTKHAEAEARRLGIDGIVDWTW